MWMIQIICKVGEMKEVSCLSFKSNVDAYNCLIALAKTSSEAEISLHYVKDKIMERANV